MVCAVRPGAVVVPRIKANSVAQVRSGTPAQLRLIWLKRLRSIGFHFEHPVGYWHTVTVSPKRSQTCTCKRSFHARVRQLLLPPASASKQEVVAARPGSSPFGLPPGGDGVGGERGGVAAGAKVDQTRDCGSGRTPRTARP